ncbi:hypothetical protein [Paractinoplanes ferrugineus]|uniref:hypothetical protein n=1 Tax=Paractinoplanes ferrugineus TaxID=113564 RepID=UPI0019434A6E|nr:hypothetical protein [Actinoplanes ferrugineus]
MVLVAAAAVTAVVLARLGHPVRAGAAPLFADWWPHLGPGTPAALLVAAAVVRFGPPLARRLSWGRLLAAGYATAVGWTLALALVDGWRAGVADRLTTQHEYLHEVPGVTDIPAMLRGFSARILDFQPDSWTTHVSGHPPGALLVFVWLDRLGLSGGGWAGLLCILVGAGTAVAVPQTVRLLGTDEAARAVVPFAVLFPGAVWIGVSADGLFAGVTAAGVALVTAGAVRRSVLAALAGGVLLGFACYLSYGLVLMAPVVAAAVLLGGARRVFWAVLGAAAVAVAFTAAGFSWWTGYHLVVERYYQGIASHRAYAYWVWADLAALAVSAGPAAAVVLRRAGSEGGRLRPRSLAGLRRISVVWLLPLAAAGSVLAADLSGYSKAEVERIWLPFAVWFAAGAALIPAGHRRFWLVAQAGTALLVNHLLFTTW